LWTLLSPGIERARLDNGLTLRVAIRRDKAVGLEVRLADFLIFVVHCNAVEHVFIVPRSKITRRTTTTLESKWLAKYADNWEAVIARDPAYESRSAVIEDPAVQADVVLAKDTHQRIAGENSAAPH
jgi:hypothetical protein